jgi:hypothetical protein
MLTPEGLVIPTVQELLDVEAEEQRGDIDPLLLNTGDSLLGNFNGIESSHLREGWEAIDAVFSALDPDNAEGSLLDGVCAFTGTTRSPATRSHFSGSHKLTVNLSPGATVTKDVTAFSVAGAPGTRFFASETVTNTTGSTANFQIGAQSEFTGPVAVNVGTMTIVSTPTTGVNSVTNGSAAALGEDIELDGPLRRRREVELRQNGSCTAPALQSRLAAYENDDGGHPVLSATVLENTTDFIDARGLRPHSFFVIVWDGIDADATDADLNAIVTANRPMGIQRAEPTPPLLGALSAGVTGGNLFARPIQVQFEVTIVVKYGAGYAGDAAVKTALAAMALALQGPCTKPGDNGEVAFSWYVGAALAVPGVKRVPSIVIILNGGAPVTNADAYTTLNQVAVLDALDVTVTSSLDV